MKRTKEEILNALHIIKETCEECVDCDICPFEKNKDCLIEIPPYNWKINDEYLELWKGLL